MPDEGSTGWSDTWMISSEGHPPELHVHVDGPHGSAEANGQATVYFGEAPTSRRPATTPRPSRPAIATTHATDEAY